MSKELEYNASSIELPSDLEHIRMRRGMYIGETLDPRQLLSEALDNALDESLAGHSSKPIQVIVDTKINKYRVRDYGRGIPHGEITDANGIDREVLEVLSTKAFSGAKFSGGSYATPVGLHGLGMSCVCALSEDVVVSTYREGKAVQLTAQNGGNVEVTKFDTEELDGVDIVFIADEPMFDSIEIPMDFILDRCRVAKAFGSDIVLTVDGEVIDIPVESIEDLIIIDKKVSQYSSDSFEYTADDGESIRVALKYTSEVIHKTTGYTNLLHNRYGGTHVRLIERAVCDVWEDFTKSTSVELKRDDVLIGLNTLVAVFLSEVEFTSQTKDRLSVPNRELTILIDGFKEHYKQHLIDNPKLRTALLKRFEEYRISQNKMLSQKEIMNLVKVNEESSGSMRRRSVVPKLIECTSNSKEGTEIYICLSGDTPLRLADGRSLTIPELMKEDSEGKLNYVYSYNHESGSIEIERVTNPRITQESAKLMRITLDNGESIKVTPNHKMMRRSGEYVEASKLVVGDALMPIDIKVNEGGYEEVYHPGKGEYELAHHLADKYNERYGLLRDISNDEKPESGGGSGGSFVRHHCDFDKLNNAPNNIERYSWVEHQRVHNKSKEHANNITKYNNKRWENYEEELAKHQGVIGWDIKTPEQLDHMRKISKEFNESVEGHEHRSRNGIKTTSNKDNQILMYKNRRRKQFLEVVELLKELNLPLTKETYETHRLKNYITWDGSLKVSKLGVAVFEDLEEMYEYVGVEYSNHKIVKIEYLSEEETVYNITVPINHNYSLSAGVIVKNCEGDSAAGPIARSRNRVTQAVLPLRGKIKNITHHSIKEALASEEVRNIVNSIGAGVGTDSDPEKSRYERVIIMTDSDPDGAHIIALIVSVLVNLVPNLMKAGMVYVCEAPLYGWTEGEMEFSNVFEEIPDKIRSKGNYTRFKGLGMMDDDEFKESCLNPEKRFLFRVDYPSDIEKFNHILGSSAGKSELMKDLGVLVDTR